MIKKIIIISVIIFGAIFVLWLYYWYNVNWPIQLSSETILTVERGESISQIIKKLKDGGLIRSELAFKIYLYLDNKTSRIKAGDYKLSGGYSISKLADVLIAGENKSNTTRVKIIEGWNLRDIDNYLGSNNLRAKENFLNLAENKIADWQFEFVKPLFLAQAPSSANLEGYLFPDTYEIFNNDSAAELIKKMIDNMGAKLDPEIIGEIARQGKSVHEVLAMASIIQKEVKTADMKMVSGIFWERLKNGQRLESCATLAYILGVNKSQYSYEDTMIDSPYNTYRNDGLPPGPISNPGLDAIRAAVYPQDSNYLFFLTRPDTGETVYSATLDEHTRNKIKYFK
jgi:UPF0755 protein